MAASTARTKPRKISRRSATPQKAKRAEVQWSLSRGDVLRLM